MISGCLVDLATRVQYRRKDPIGFPAIRQLLQHLVADFGSFGALIRAPVHLGQKDLQIRPISVLLQGGSEFGNGLRIEVPVRVHARQGAPCQSHLVWLKSVPPADQTLEFLLDCRVGGVGFESPLHVPDGRVQVPFIFSDDRHADVGDEVIRHSGKYTLEDVRRVAVPLGFEVRFSQQAIDVEMFGV